MKIFIYFTALFVFILLSFLFILVLRNEKKNYLQFLLIGFIITIAAWILFLFFEDFSTQLNYAKASAIFNSCKYLFITLTPIWILLISFYFAKDGKPIHKIAYLLALNPLLTQFGLLTNSKFHLFYSTFIVFHRPIGPLYAVHIFLFYVNILISIVYLFIFSLRTDKEMRSKAMLVLLSTILPLLANMLYFSGTIALSAYATPVCFAITAFSFYKAISKYNFLENTPLVLRSIVDRISYVYIVLDEHLTIVDFNEPAFKTFPSHRLKKGNNFREIINAYNAVFDYNKILSTISEARKTAKTIKTEIVYHPTEHNDTDCFFQCEFTPVFQKGRYRACILMGKDITQSKKDYASFVEQERLASIAQMIGNVVQNLRAPVLRLSNSTENIDNITTECLNQIKDKTLSQDDFQEIIREIRQNLQNQRAGLEAFESILSAITEQTEQLAVENDKTFSITELVKRVEFLMKENLKETQCTLRTSINGNDEIRIKGDLNSLVHVIQALIMNSIHAYNGAEGFIYFNVSSKKGLVTISIGDYAGGIPLEVQDKLFKQVVTTKGKNSSGISLYMAHATIIGHFQGKLWFTSKENEGSEFFIELPFLKATNDSEKLTT